jgi:hypothetical protein
MCVNCFNSVDAVAWNIVGASTAATAGWHHIRGRLAPSIALERRRRGREETSTFVAELRSLDGDEDALWPFLLALLSFVVLGLVLKTFVLNWVVGPLYLVVVLHALPRGLRRLAWAARS